MLILLPPSEGKASPVGEHRLDLRSLVFADRLGEARAELIAALRKLACGPEKQAIEALGISAGQAGEIARDAELTSSPAGPVSEVYTGVLYDRLGFGSLPASVGPSATCWSPRRSGDSSGPATGSPTTVSR